MITLRKMSRGDIEKKLTMPFNPPLISNTFTEECFHEEWHFTQDAINRELQTTWCRDDYGFGDYTMGVSTNFSRGISVTATSNLFIRSDLISKIQSVLMQIPHQYEIHLLLGETGEGGQLFIDRDEVSGACTILNLELLGLEIVKTGE